MKTEIELQKENIQALLKLIAENPDLSIVPMVDSDVVADDEYSSCLGSWGKPKIDFRYDKSEQIYFKNRDSDFEDLEDKYITDHWGEQKFEALSDEEQSELARKKVDELPWEKVIVVYIELP